MAGDGNDTVGDVAGNQAFAFIGGAAFTGVAGQLRYSGSSLLGDVNGDGAADFQIKFTGAPPSRRATSFFSLRSDPVCAGFPDRIAFRPSDL